MTDLVLETVRVLVLAGIVGFLWQSGRKRLKDVGDGWNLIVAGFCLLLFGSLLDITDNFEELNRFIVVGDTEIEAFLEKLVGFLGGFAVLALGLVRWLPKVGAHRQQTEAALRASEARLRAILDHAPMEIYLKDRGGRYVEVNKRYEDLWGVSNAQARGKLPDEVHHDPVFAEASRSHDLAVLRGGHAIEQEDDVDLNGARHTLHMIKFPIASADGEVAGLGAIAIDVTGRKRAEAALRESEKRYRDIVENVGDLIQNVGPDQRYTFVNKAWTLALGYDDDDLKSLTFSDVLHEDYLPHCREIFERLGRGEAFENVEAVFKAKDGREIAVEGHLSSVLDGGRMLRTLAIFRDVTERKKAVAVLARAHEDLERRVEERTEELRRSNDLLRSEKAKLREILEKSPVGVAITTRSKDDVHIAGDRLFFNDALVRMFGGTDRDSFVEARIDDSWVDLDELATVEEKFRSGEDLVDFEVQRRRVDGTTWWVSMNTRQIKFDGQDCTMVWHFDITERRLAEDQLRQAQKMEAVGQLTGGIAHDFNNLLGIILGNAELLSDRIGEDDAQTQALMRAATRGAELTQRLLAFSRRQPLQPKPIDVGALASGMVEMLRRSLGVAIEIEVGADRNLWTATADPGLLENALLNLAINARDAMSGAGRLVIETGNATLDEIYLAGRDDVPPGDYVMLAVTDNGSGMAPEVLDRVFEPFYTTKEVGKGSGLGLSMVYGFAKQSGGHIAIYSEEGEGTTVKLYLPRTEDAAVRAVPQVDEVPRGRGETVLVVEDDADIRELAVVLLGGLGYEVLEAGNGEAALEIFGQVKPVELLLSDVVLPGVLSGPDLALEASSRDANLKIVFMSGYAEDAVRLSGWLDKRADLLPKPFRKLDLARKVRAALDRTAN